MEEFARQSAGSNYCIKILLPLSGDNPEQFSPSDIKRIKELDQGPLFASKTRQKAHTKSTVKLTHKRNASALAEDSHHLGNIECSGSSSSSELRSSKSSIKGWICALWQNIAAPQLMGTGRTEGHKLQLLLQHLRSPSCTHRLIQPAVTFSLGFLIMARGKWTTGSWC